MGLTTVLDTSIDADSAIDVSLMTALRDNGMFGNLIAVTPYTSSNTHTCDADCRATLAILWGGGGAGGGATGANANGEGGKAGEMVISYVSSRTGSDSLTVTIGAGGTGVSGGNGNQGGTTSLTGHTSAVGGLGGTAAAIYNNVGMSGDTGILIGGAARSGGGAGNAAAANSSAGGGGASSSGGTYAGGAGGSGYLLILEFSGNA